MTDDDVAFTNSYLQLMLDLALPDRQIVEDVHSTLGSMGLGTPELLVSAFPFVPIPSDAAVVILAKTFFKERFSFPGVYKVRVGLGAVKDQMNGFVDAEYGFATLWYDQSASLASINFEEDVTGNRTGR